MKIKLRYSRKPSEVYAGMPGIPCGVLDGQDVVLRVRVSIQDNVVVDLRHIKNPVQFGLIVTGYGVDRSSRKAQKAVEQIRAVQSIASCAADRASASESEFQERKYLEIYLLPVNEWPRNVWMPFQL